MKLTANAAAETRSIRVLWLGEDIGLAQELKPFFAARGLAAEVVLASEGASLSGADLALAYFADPAMAGGMLCPVGSLRTVVWPPLVAILTRNPNRADLERMRRQGVVHATREIDSTFANVVKRLVDPTSARQWAIGPGRLAEALASAEGSSASGLVCVSCPHWSGSSTYPWENSTLFYCGEREQGRCSGWVGRIYLVGGAITLAETPQVRGLPALQQMLALRAGAMMRFPFYLSPDTTEPLGPAGAAVAQAAARVGEATQTARVAEVRRPTPERGAAPAMALGSRSEPARGSAHKETMPMPDLESVLAASTAFIGATRVSASGNPAAVAGDIDAQMVAAVVHLASDHVQGVAAALPLGSVIGFGVGARGGACFVRHDAKGRSTLVVRSGPTQTPTRTLTELARFG